MHRFGVFRKVLPEMGSVLRTSQVSLRVTLLGVDEVGELGRVTQEKDWSVIEDPVHVAFLGLHLDRETTRVTSSVWRTRFTTDGGETGSDWAFFANVGEDAGQTNVFERISALEDTVGASTLGVDNTLRNALSIEVRKKIDQV